MTAVSESAAASDTLRWREEWPRFRTWQYVATPLVLGGAIVTRYVAPDPPPSWTGGILFDDPVVDRLSLRHEGPRWASATVTDEQRRFIERRAAAESPAGDNPRVDARRASA